MYTARKIGGFRMNGFRPTRQAAGMRCIYSRGFTLLEVILSVAILGMMAMSIYRFVQTHIVAMRVSSQVTAADGYYNGLRELLCLEWQQLSSGENAIGGESAKLESRPRDEIHWKCGPGQGLLTRYALGEFTVFLRLRPSPTEAGQFDLGLLRRPQSDSEIEHGNDTWVTLIPNVASLQVLYWTPPAGVKPNGELNWLDKWDETAQQLPRLVKVAIGRTDAPGPWEVVVPLGRTPF